MFSHEESSITNMPSRRFDLSMSKRTRKPKIFGEAEQELASEEDDQASLPRSSLKELMTDSNNIRKEDEAAEMEWLDRGETGEEKSSNLALVARKGSFVGKYMKVLKHLIKAKRDPAKRRAMMRLPVK